jgi:hypothetical protein
MLSVKAQTQLTNLLIKLKIVIGGTVSKSFISNSRSLLRNLRLIKESQGSNGLVKFLKTFSVLIQQTSGGFIIQDVTPLGPRLSRTKGSGLPRIIPASWRNIILRKDLKSKFLLKYLLTISNIYRIIESPYKESIKTIISPGRDTLDGPLYIREFIRSFISDRDLNRFFSFISERTKTFNIYKSSPLSSPFFSTDPVTIYLSWLALKADPLLLKSFINLRSKFDSLNSLYLLDSLWGNLVKWKEGVNPALDIISKGLKGYPTFLSTGKLGFKKEPASKLRVFAMVDCVTQWLLKPLHTYLFRILSKISMDGTFNQMRPIRRLLNIVDRLDGLYSLDLSAATDRLPVKYQELIISEIAGSPIIGEAWKDFLVGRPYDYTFPFSKKQGSVKYSVGQPMGALSSWAMLAITHHWIVQLAAWRAHVIKVGTLFKDYAILGDDILIGNKAVMIQYLKILSLMGVEVGLPKSILSPKKEALEFAKRTIIIRKDSNNKTVNFDISPIPLKELSSAFESLSAWVEFSKKYNISLYSQTKFLGYGHKASRWSFRKVSYAFKALILANMTSEQFSENVSTYIFYKDTNKHRKYFYRLLYEFASVIVIPKLVKLLALFEEVCEYRFVDPDNVDLIPEHTYSQLKPLINITEGRFNIMILNIWQDMLGAEAELFQVRCKELYTLVNKAFYQDLDSENAFDFSDNNDFHGYINNTWNILETLQFTGIKHVSLTSLMNLYLFILKVSLEPRISRFSTLREVREFKMSKMDTKVIMYKRLTHILNKLTSLRKKRKT